MKQIYNAILSINAKPCKEEIRGPLIFSIVASLHFKKKIIIFQFK